MADNLTAQSNGRLHRHHAIILIFALFVHGLLLLNDGVYYDGWLVRTFLEFNNHERMQRWFFDSGVPHIYYLHLWLGALPGGVFAYKLIAFLCITFSGLLIYSIAHKSGLVGRLESLLIALLALCYPAFQAASEITISPFLICYALFLLAVLLALRAEEASGRPRVLLSIAALLCFIVSFTIPSLLVFYGGFLWLLAASMMHRQGWNVGRLWRGCLWREFVPFRLHYLLLPIVFWIARQVLLPPQGAYAEYNQFKLNAYSLIYNFRTFLASSIFDQFNAALAQLSQPVQWLILLLMAQSIYVLCGLARRGFTQGATRPSGRLWFGVALLLMGLLPYVLVGKAPDVAGFGTRHALLIGLPIAIILISLIRLIFPGDDNKGEDTLSNPGWVFLLSLLLLFSMTMANSYLDWQARWIKSRVVMAALAGNKAASEYSTYWVRDHFDTGEHDAWVFLEWSSLFKTIWGDETRAGMDVSSPDLLRVLAQRPQLFTAPSNSHFNLSRWNVRGQQADLTIERGPAAASNGRIVGYYFYYKFIRPAGMSGFLQQVATVRVTPAAKPRAMPLP